jgi:hypothetical protein
MDDLQPHVAELARKYFQDYAAATAAPLASAMVAMPRPAIALLVPYDHVRAMHFGERVRAFADALQADGAAKHFAVAGFVLTQRLYGIMLFPKQLTATPPVRRTTAPGVINLGQVLDLLPKLIERLDKFVAGERAKVYLRHDDEKLVTYTTDSDDPDNIRVKVETYSASHDMSMYYNVLLDDELEILGLIEVGDRECHMCEAEFESDFIRGFGQLATEEPSDGK